MVKERRKIIRAGRLWYAMQYTTIRGPECADVARNGQYYAAKKK